MGQLTFSVLFSTNLCDCFKKHLLDFLHILNFCTVLNPLYGLGRMLCNDRPGLQ